MSRTVLISRRRFLAGASAAWGALHPLAARADTLDADVPETLRSWQQQLVDYGTRYTGSSGQDLFVDFLAARLEEIGLEVHVDRIAFDRWEPIRWTLSEADGADIPLSYYYPYSGETSEDGFTAEVVYCGMQTSRGAFTLVDGTNTRDAGAFFAPARGKIALVDAPIPELESATFFTERGFYPRAAGADWPSTIVNPLFQGNANPVDLTAARAAGVGAVICAWTNASDEEARFQYNPFKTPYQNLPAVWVTRSTAARVKRLAAAGTKVTLILTAEHTRSATSNSIWCRIPGRRSDEVMIVNTHTDGGNAIEENGGLGLLRIAAHYARLPREAIARDIVLVFVTGHFQQPQFEVPGGYEATSRWKADHPDIWRKAVAGVTVEHLGCLEWSDAAGTRPYAPTGVAEWGIAFTSSGGAGSPTAPPSRLFLDAAAENDLPRSLATSPPETRAFLGEGKQFFADGIPLVSFVPIPSYLLRAGPDLELGKVDHDLMARQIQAMLDVTLRTQTMSAAELAGG